MRIQRTRTGDSAFELNLAPFLDIIVSIVPMLLLSIAFVQIKMIESPTPQIVSQDQVKTPPKPETTITLHISKKSGMQFEVSEKSGKKEKVSVVAAAAAGTFDFKGLTSSAISLKAKYPEVTTLQMAPDGDVAFDDLVQAMDAVREKPHIPNTDGLSFTDKSLDAKTENRQVFPDIVFASVGG